MLYGVKMAAIAKTLVTGRSRMIMACWFTGWLIGMGGPAGLYAQTTPEQPRWIDEQIEQLRQQQQGQPPGQGQTGNSPLLLPPSLSSRQEAGTTAALVVRMENYERTLRQLTGQIEELRHLVKQTVRDMHVRLDDTDLRLQDLEDAFRVSIERSLADSASADSTPEDSALQGSAGRNSVLQPQVPEVAVEAPGEAAAPAPGAGVLGVIPQDAVSPGDPARDYDAAINLLRQREIESAQEALQQFLVRYPGSTLTGNALYWLGETYYVQGDYERAVDNFQSGFQYNTNGAKAPDHLLKWAMSLAHLGQTQTACEVFDNLERQFPGADRSIRQRTELEKRRNNC